MRIDRLGVAPAVVAVVAAVAVCAACGDHGASPGGSTRSASLAQPGSDRVADTECDRTPSAGTRTQALGGFRFTRGEVRVRVKPTTKPAPESKSDGGQDATDDVCLGFRRSGEPNPLLPVDSVVLTFANSPGNGVIVDVPLVELVSRRAEITGTIWVVGDGARLRAPSCVVRPRTVTEQEVSASFECSDAMPVESNPFTPDDRIDPDDQSPETPTPPVPSPPQSPTTPSPTAPPPASPPSGVAQGSATLQGWFAVGQ